MLSEHAAAAARRAAEPKFLASDSDTRQDWTALAAHLDEHGFRFDPKIDTPRQFSGGFGNLNYLVQVDGAPMVLRRRMSRFIRTTKKFVACGADTRSLSVWTFKTPTLNPPTLPVSRPPATIGTSCASCRPIRRL